MEHSDVIRSFGDEGTACARALSSEMAEPIDRETVYKWKENGIPSGYWPALVTAARKAGIANVTFESLALGRPKAA